MKNISVEHSREILKKLCEAVGENADTFDFEQPNWYWKYTWTEEDEETFRKWLGKFLVKHGYAKGKKRGIDAGYYEAGKILGNYGWKRK